MAFIKVDTKDKLVEFQILENNFYDNIKNILQNARNNAYRQINFIMVESYWNIGKQIVEEEQKGKDKTKLMQHLPKGIIKNSYVLELIT